MAGKCLAVGKALVQSPEAADETLGVLGYRLGEVAALRGNRADNRYRAVGSV